MPSTQTTTTKISDASSTEQTTHNGHTTAAADDWTPPQIITTEALVSTDSAAVFHSTPTKIDNKTDGHCLCKCSSQLNLDDPDVLANLSSRLATIRKNLYVEKKSLSNTKRKLLSAPDDRPSSKYIGTVGITVLVVVGLALVSSDIVQLCRCFLHKFKN